MSHSYHTTNLFLVPLNVSLVYSLVLLLEFRSVLKMCSVFCRVRGRLMLFIKENTVCVIL